MNDGFRRFLVLLAVFFCAFLAVLVTRKIQNGASLKDILTGGKSEEKIEEQNYTLRLKPSIDLNQVEVLAAINAESAALVRTIVPSVVSIDTAGVRPQRFRDRWSGRILTLPQAVQGQGSGVIVTEEGHVLTNHHVIKGTPRIRLTLHDGTVHSARVIGTDETVDIAVLKIDDDGPFEALKFGDSSSAEVGDAVFAIGSPFGLGTSVTDGKISAKKRPFSDSQVDLLQTSAPINPGNSGGPLVNIRGEIIGINSRIYSTDRENPGFQGIGFAVPSNAAYRTFRDILKKGRPTRGFLGMALQNLDPYARRQFNFNERVGVHVIGLVPGSPATEAGLQVDDIIIRYQDQAVKTMNRLISMIQQSQVGSEVTLEVWREGAKHTLTAVIGEAENYNKEILKPQEDTTGSRPDPTTIINKIGIDVRDATAFEKANGAAGVIVTIIRPNSILRGKLITGDQILSINSIAVHERNDFFSRLVAHASVQDTELIIRRGEQSFGITIYRLR